MTRTRSRKQSNIAKTESNLTIVQEETCVIKETSATSIETEKLVVIPSETTIDQDDNQSLDFDFLEQQIELAMTQQLFRDK